MKQLEIQFDPTQKRKRRLPKFPIRAPKAYMQLLQAIVTGDDELASWIDRAVLTDNVTGTTRQISALRRRLDEVMEPLD